MKKNLKKLVTVTIGATSLLVASNGIAYGATNLTMTSGISLSIGNYLQSYASIEADTKTLSALAGVVLDTGVLSNETETNDSLGIVDESFGYNNLGVTNVTDSCLNIREDGTTSSSIVGKLPANGGCEILEEKNGWYKISSGKVTGWVSGDYILTGDEAKKYAKTVAKNMATVIDVGLRVREQPTTDSRIITFVPNGETLAIEEMNNGWLKIAIDNDYGWISGDYATVGYALPDAMTLTEIRYGEGVSDVRVDLINEALKYVGNSYVWGGTSLTNGVDCSGFTMQIYKKYGITLPHYSGAQARCGTSISSADAKPGDLFFYGNGGTISHVAIYLGNGKIVHASSPTVGIIVSNAFYRSPLCVVRLIND